MGKPNFFIIGEPKCGTTIIHDYLSQHKDIFLPNKKEPNHFCKDFCKDSKRINGDVSEMLLRCYSIEELLSLFENRNEKYQGEATVLYANSEVAANEIYDFNPNSKILYTIREPVSMLQSWHGQLLKMGYEDEKSFLKALEKEGYRKEGKHLPKHLRFYKDIYYSEWIKFAEHLKRYLDCFSKEQIKVIIYEEFKKDNQKTIDEITDFLGVYRIEIEHKEVNVRAKPKYPGFKNFFEKSFRIRAFAQKILPYDVRKKWGNFINWMIPYEKDKPYELPEEEKIKLMKQFKPEVEKINNLLHEYELIAPEIDLVKYWGYDKL